MKIYMAIFLLLSTGFSSIEPEIEKVRALYAKAPMDQDACKALINLLKVYDEDTPLLYGYKGVGTMIMAKHVFNPFKKISYFKDGKAMLEEAIEMEPSNIELRFLRFTAQTQAPGFLGYKQDIENDKYFLLNSIPNMESDLIKQVQSFLLKSDYTTETERKQLKNKS